MLDEKIKTAINLLRAAKEKADIPSGPLPQHLYHYTNAEGLYGILRTRTIWATHFDFLNDRSEFSYAFEILKERLTAQAGADASAKLIPALDKWPNLMGPHYVASFCEDGDLLSQWRGYAQTNDGYAIGFKSGNLSKRGPDLAQLIYPRAEQTRFLDSLLSFAIKASVDLDDAGQLTLISAALGSPIMHLYRFKHELFSGEREWRLIGRLKDGATERFRTAHGHFVPYIAVPVEADDIDVIVQGPGAYRPGNKEAIERFAKSCGFAPTVIRSEVPLA
jgi:hypothetical protein